jgi:hypothetical protein
MADIYKIVLSSAFVGLEEHRNAARQVISSQQMLPIAMEDDAALPDQDLIDASLAKVDDSDGYVGLIGYRYGQTPICPLRNPHCLSLTELEFRRAQERNIPICMFIMHDDHLIPKRAVREYQDWPKYDSFLCLAKKDRIFAECFAPAVNRGLSIAERNRQKYKFSARSHACEGSGLVRFWAAIGQKW